MVSELRSTVDTEGQINEKGVESWKKGEMKNFEEYQHFKDGRKRNPEKKKKKTWVGESKKETGIPKECDLSDNSQKQR